MENQEKKLYFELRDNAEMCVTVHDLDTCKEIIDDHVFSGPKGDLDEDVEEMEFTITPVYMTEEEYEALGESESY